jgi:hypothetical protein
MDLDIFKRMGLARLDTIVSISMRTQMGHLICYHTESKRACGYALPFTFCQRCLHNRLNLSSIPQIHHQIAEYQQSTTGSRMPSAGSTLDATIASLREGLPGLLASLRPGNGDGDPGMQEGGGVTGDVHDRYRQMERLVRLFSFPAYTYFTVHQHATDFIFTEQADQMLSTLAVVRNDDLDLDRFENVRGGLQEMMVAMDRYAAEHHISEEEQGGGEDMVQTEPSNEWDEVSSFITWSPTEEMEAAQAPVRAFDLAYESSSQSPSDSAAPLPPLSTQSEESTHVENLAPATSRFSTVVGNRERERIVIDLDEDDADESSETEELEYHEGNNYVDAEEDFEEEYISASEGEESEPESFSQDVSRNEHPQTDPTSLCLDPDSEPPFVTDGRGRVVWSSGRSGRSVQSSGGSGGAGRPRAWSSKVNAASAGRKSSVGGSSVATADLSESEMEGRLGEI